MTTDVHVKISVISIFYLFFSGFHAWFYEMRWFYPYRSFIHSKWWCRKL